MTTTKQMNELNRMDKIVGIEYRGEQHGAVAAGPVQITTLPVRFLRLDNETQKGATFTKVLVATATGTVAINCYPGTTFAVESK